MIEWISNRTVRTRLTLWYVLIMGIVLIGFSAVVVFVVERSLAAGVDDTLTERTNSLMSIIEIEGSRPVLPEAVVIAETFDEFDDDDDGEGILAIQDEEPFARTYDLEGNIVSNAGAHPALPVPQEMVTDALNGNSTRATLGSGEDSFRVLTRPLLDSGEIIGAIEVGQPREDLVETIASLINDLLIVVPITIAIASIGGWFLARRALMPVDEMTSIAREISAQDLSRRLDLKLPDDEFGRLASTLDTMIARLDTAFQQQRQFTADASHELRTPLTALKGHTEITLERLRTPEEYRDALERIDGEVGRLITLVQRLLVLARADAGQIPLEREAIEVNQLVEAAVEQLAPQAEQRGVALNIEPGPPVHADVDESLLLQLLMNLLDNGIRHTPAHGLVTLRWRDTCPYVEIDVLDTGEGIDPDDLPYVFDRFYRADRARSRREGSTGLGLAISKWIAEAHGGSIRVESSPGNGARFTLSLPAIPEAHDRNPMS